jgi:hypothetical protein
MLRQYVEDCRPYYLLTLRMFAFFGVSSSRNTTRMSFPVTARAKPEHQPAEDKRVVGGFAQQAVPGPPRPAVLPSRRDPQVFLPRAAQTQQAGGVSIAFGTFGYVLLESFWTRWASCGNDPVNLSPCAICPAGG